MERDFIVVASPNYDDRPPGVRVDCVVLHATVIDLRPTLMHLTNPRSTVSSHYVVDRDGTVYQLVDIEKRAWHAGTSEFHKIPHVNDFSVGIEMVNRNDGKEKFTDRQYHSVAHIIGLLRSKYGYTIPNSRIIGHTDIAVPKGRKSDPRGFDFARLFRLLAARSPGKTHPHTHAHPHHHR